jgi:hypothetical protein
MSSQEPLADPDASPSKPQENQPQVDLDHPLDPPEDSEHVDLDRPLDPPGGPEIESAGYPEPADQGLTPSGTT